MHPSSPERDHAFSAVLLAGGRSVRMGRDKALLPHPVSGRPLILHQLDTLRAAGAAELFLSLRSGTDYPLVPATVTRLFDDGTRGPMAGIATALAAARHPRLLVLAVDLPGVTPEILTAWRARAPINTGYVPVSRNGAEPLCAFYPRAASVWFEQALADGRLTLQTLIAELVRLGLVQSSALPPGEAELLWNWNQPTDGPPTDASARRES